jgi:hypothetical protein
MSWIHHIFTFHEEGLLVSAEARKGWVDGHTALGDDNSLWKQYGVYVDLYKFYVDIAWKGSIWYFATVGAILTFLFANVGKPGSGPLIYILIFVALVSFGFAILYLRSALGLHELAEFFDYIARQLHLTGRPHVEFLPYFLIMVTAFCSIIGLGSVVILIVYLNR